MLFQPPLLSPGEIASVTALREDSVSPFVILCDHACNRIPEKLGRLGLPDSDIARHIGWDIGALGTSLLLSAALDAPLVYQNYSRLVIDCNRQSFAPSSIPAQSEATEIPGNIGLSSLERQARYDEILVPYHARIVALLDARAARGLPTCLILMHSFTPIFLGEARPWQVGVLFDRMPEFSRTVMALLAEDKTLTVGENEPYAVGDETDYAVPVHAYPRQLPYVELEIRQDLIASEEGQQDWSSRLARVLPAAWAQITATPATLVEEMPR